MIRELLTQVVPLIASASSLVGLTESDSYDIEVFDSASPLLISFELLERSRNLAVYVPTGKYLHGQAINTHDWIEYHVSTFLITCVTVRDEALLLVNGVFHLGLDPRHCNLNILRKNKWVKDTIIPKHLEAIESAIKTIRKERNLHVHQGKPTSFNKLLKTGNFDELKKISFAMRQKPEKCSDLFKGQVDAAYVKLLAEIDKKLNDKLNELKTAVWGLLTDLHAVYAKRRSKLFPPP